MWCVLKTEIGYHQIMLSIAFGAILLIAVSGLADLEHMDWLTWMPFLIIFSTLNTSQQKEKRYRFLAQLPVSPGVIAKARITLLFSIYFFVLLLWLPTSWQKQSVAGDADGWLLFATGIMVANAFAAAYVFQDLTQHRKGALRKFAILVVLFLAILVLIFAIILGYKGEPNRPVVVDYLKSVALPAYFILPLPVLYFISISTFKKRKSYLENGARVCG